MITEKDLTAIISVKVPEPQFEGQTKTKLGNRDVQGLVESLANEHLSTYCEENPKSARAMVNKVLDASRAREAARKSERVDKKKGGPFWVRFTRETCRLFQ